MKAKYYASEENKACLYISTELGKATLTIKLSDNKLNWNEIFLDKDQTKKLLKFLTDSVMQ